MNQERRQRRRGDPANPPRRRECCRLRRGQSLDHLTREPGNLAIRETRAKPQRLAGPQIAQLALLPGEGYGLPHYVRMTFAVPTEQIHAAGRLIGEACAVLA